MPDKRPHIKPEELAALIRRYLAGELNDKAMHDLERQALDDPFLADALEGYAGHAPDQQAHQADLASRLQARVAPQRSKIRALYYRWAAAAAILLLLFSGGWFLWNQQRSAPPIAGIPAPPASTSPQVPAPATVTPDASAPSAQEAVPANSADIRVKKTTPGEAVPANSADVPAKKVTPRAAAPSKQSAAEADKSAEPAPAAIQPATAPAPVIEAERPEKPLTALAPVPVISPEKAKQNAFAPASKSDSQQNGLNEVVVVGYGVQKRRNVTGSTVRIRGTATTPAADSTRVEDALAGRVAGLNTDKGNVLEDAYRAPSPLTGETAFENYLRTKTVNPGNQYNGTVRVSFTVMPDGTLQDFKVIRHLNDACDAEAIRVIKEGPGWTPASDGKPAKVKVRVRFTVKKD